MDAVDALNEIAFWLERELAPTFKVKAFRTAAVTIGALTRDELAARALDGRLRKLKGIGDRSHQVIQQALAGQVPDYLTDLRERGAMPLATGGEGLKLRGDLHTHSDWSDGGSPIELMVQTGQLLGRDYLAITDHSPNLKIANGLSAERLTRQLAIIDRLNDSSPMRVLKGIEVDILESGRLDQTPAMLAKLDIVVASVHSKLRSDKATM